MVDQSTAAATAPAPGPRMADVAVTFGRALAAQLSPRMLALSLLPTVLSVTLWGVLLWFGWQPFNDWMHHQFVAHDWFRTSGSLLSSVGLGMLRTLVVPLLAMLLLLPLMILTALVFVGVAAMPVVVRHVSTRAFPELVRKEGGSWWGSVGMALASFAVFVVVFLATLPLYAVPPLALVAHMALWGWLTARVVAYDALVDHASDEERHAIMRTHRWPLLLIGTVSGVAGALPGIVWVGGSVLAVVLFPFLAAVSIWLYVGIFIFTGLWFEHYCLLALRGLRAARGE